MSTPEKKACPKHPRPERPRPKRPRPKRLCSKRLSTSHENMPSHRTSTRPRTHLWPDTRCIFLYFSEAIKEAVLSTKGVTSPREVSEKQTWRMM